MKSRSRNKEKGEVSVTYYRIPESFSALLRMVSFTAAKTNRMFDVSVAWVRLGQPASAHGRRDGILRLRDLLRIEIQMCPVDLIKSPQKVFGRLVDVVAARVVWEVVAQWRPAQLLLEDVDFVEEQYYTCSHEPSRVDNRIKQE